MTPIILAMNGGHLVLADRIAAIVGGSVHAHGKRINRQGTRTFADPVLHLRSLFADGHPIVAIIASGIVVRALAPALADKHSEPPVLAVSDDGAQIVPLLGGHHGANALARRLAEALDCNAAITTAGDTRLGLALDQPPSEWTLVSGDPKGATALLLDGARLEIDPRLDWITAPAYESSAKRAVRLGAFGSGEDSDLIYCPRTVAIGVGCERNADPSELIGLVRSALRDADVSDAEVAVVASIDLKSDEAAVHALASELGVEARFLSALSLANEESRLQTPSEIVRGEVGVAGVAEGAALAAVGEQGSLVVPKTKSKRCTVALARSLVPFDGTSVGVPRGELAVVGLGPGTNAWRSPEADAAIAASSDVVGYSLYLDLCGAMLDGRERHDFPLGAEEARVRASLALAAEGRRVALVCSGDPGIYAMAALVHEVLHRGDVPDAWGRVAVRTCPGISALQAAAARVGAPLGHDFCAISLSDLLTPWDVIARRINAAAEGDFVIAFYNPVSQRRRTQLAHARDVLLRHRPANTPVILASNLGRPTEWVRVTSLANLTMEEVDMLTTVIVGSTQTMAYDRGDGSRCVYTPRGYAAKDGSAIRRNAVSETAQ